MRVTKVIVLDKDCVQMSILLYTFSDSINIPGPLWPGNLGGTGSFVSLSGLPGYFVLDPR